ncbi:MAG TPA: PspC domain-containing protein [Granulicella sp.]|jgi:phage shock protein C|nr:PspC domain-containing protein [Granulicella sp.]
MFCPSCGKSIDLNARFCSNCGAAVAAAAPPPTYPLTGRLVRPRHPRMIAGVCAGFAEHYHWDISLVRVVAVLLAIFTSGIGVLAYLAAWIIIPEAPYTLPYTTGSPTV